MMIICYPRFPGFAFLAVNTRVRQRRQPNSRAHKVGGFYLFLLLLQLTCNYILHYDLCFPQDIQQQNIKYIDTFSVLNFSCLYNFGNTIFLERFQYHPKNGNFTRPGRYRYEYQTSQVPQLYCIPK